LRHRTDNDPKPDDGWETMMDTARSPLRVLAALWLAGSALPASAETLQEALAAAYRDNPTLTAARAGQQATDESVNIQLAQGRPSAQNSASFQENIYRDPANPFASNRSLSSSTQLSMPVYSGGRVRNGIQAAERRVEAGQFNLKGTELTVFSRVVAAYMDVIRGQSVVSLSRNNVEVLEVNLKATKDRFEVGDLTRTDVAQSEARLALARSDLKNAESQLISARETYIQVVGHAPVDLQPPPPLPGLPESADMAVDIALASNPDLAAAKKAREAAHKDVQVAQGARLPTVTAVSSGQYNTDLGSTPSLPNSQSYTTNVTIGATVTVPLYQGGGPGAQVRRTRALESQATEQQTATERNVVAQTRSLYASWQASNQVIESTQVAVASTALSLQGVRAENSVGTRTILDILNAEQESFSARVQLVTAQRNAYVAGFSLLAAMGKASAADLSLASGPLYDPAAHFGTVRGKLMDWNGGATPAPVASRTVDSPAQNATVNAAVTNIATP
jgi:outer membrane protein